MSGLVDTNPAISIDVSDSFFAQSQVRDEDFYKEIDERMNVKLAEGMKKVASLIVTRFESVIQDKIRLMVKDEVEGKIEEIRESMPSRTPRLERILNRKGTPRVEISLNENKGKSSPEKRKMSPDKDKAKLGTAEKRFSTAMDKKQRQSDGLQ